MTKKKKVEKNFIDFIMDAQQNPELLKDFLFLREEADFAAYFETQYRGISQEDIKKIATMMETFHKGLYGFMAEHLDVMY